MGIAAAWTGWQRRANPRLGLGAHPGSSGEVVGTFPQDSLPIRVELLLGGVWTDISGYVYYRDQIRISRGRSNERSTAEPGTCQLTLDNRDGRFSPRNPMGAYYGSIGRNTQLRVFILHPNSPWVRRYRFWGEVSEWPVQWDVSGNDVYASITASGIGRRLTQGASPLRSAYSRAVVAGTAGYSGVVAYWPCEDAVGSTSLASGISGGKPIAINGTPVLASDTSFAASDALPVMGSASFTGRVSMSNTGSVRVTLLGKVPVGTPNNAVLFSVKTGGTAVQWDLVYQTGGVLILNAYDSAGAAVLSTAPVAFGLDEMALRYYLVLNNSGSDVVYNFSTLQAGAGGLTSGGTLAGYAIGACSRVIVAPSRNLNGSCSDTSLFRAPALPRWMPHCRSTPTSARTPVFDSSDSATNRASLAMRTTPGYPRTRDPSTRWVRRLKQTLIELLRECETTDHGLLFDMREAFGLRLRLA